MKTRLLVCASVITLLITTLAYAGVWDFGWFTEAFFPREPVPVHRGESGTSTATVAPQPSGGIVIGFDTPFGASSVAVAPDGQAIGNVPIFLKPVGPPEVSPSTCCISGRYSFSGGSFTDPGTFSLNMGVPGSGPSGPVRFTGTGVRQTVEAAEPEVALLLLGGLTVAAWLRRQPR